MRFPRLWFFHFYFRIQAQQFVGMLGLIFFDTS
jgi:hypothetical protein